MDIQKVLSEAAGILGPSGQEMQIAAYFAEKFRPFVDEVTVNDMHCMIAHKKGTGPKVMLCAHMDEISLMVIAIEDDGCLRLGNVGGVDPRILPASRVWVHGKEKLFGTIGALPPHLMSAEDRTKAYTREELFVDLCMAPEKVKKLVNIGDLITLQGPAVKLLNHRAAAKTVDDRSCVGCLLLAAERLQKMQHMCDIYFVASSQEEVGGRGAAVASYTVDPDLAVVLDVTFAPTPQCPPDTTCPLDAPATAYGPYVQHRLLERLKQTAKENGVTLNCEHTERSTGTDADDVQIARAGVPCVLLSLPVKYMHTSVELLDMNTLSECGRLLALFVAGIDEKWEDGLWN